MGFFRTLAFQQLHGWALSRHFGSLQGRKRTYLTCSIARPPRQQARALERERLRRVHQEITDEVRSNPGAMVAIRASIPYKFYGDAGMVSRVRKARVFVSVDSCQSIDAFRAALRLGLLRLHPSLRIDRHFGRLMESNISFKMALNSSTLLEHDEQLTDIVSSEKTDGLNLVLTPIQEAIPQNMVAPLPERLVGLDPEAATHVEVMSFYRFVKIDDPDQTSAQLRTAWLPYGVVGRVYVAREGINAQIAVPVTTLTAFLRDMKVDPLSHDSYAIPSCVKGVFLNRDTEVTKEESPFSDLRVKPRHQVLADGLDEPLDWSRAGNVVDAEEWHQALTTSEDMPILLDCRNKYESEVGKFVGAQALGTSTFRESWDWLEEKLKDVPKESKIMTYCTGGIRCVKVGAYLEQKMGFENVDRLEGGIVAYSKMLRENGLQPDESTFKGVNYVFDMRIGERVTSDILTTCQQCGTVCDLQTDCANEKCDRPFADRHFVQCTECAIRMRGTCSEDCLATLEKRRTAVLSGKPTDIRRTKSGRIPLDDEVPIVSPEAERYSTAHSTGEPAHLATLRERTEAELPSRAHMLCGSVEGRFLRTMVSLASAREMLELGTFTGYSALWMASGLAADGRLVTCDVDEECLKLAREAFAEHDDGRKIELRAEPADDVLSDLAEEGRAMDLIFMDANKKQYLNYYEKILKLGLLRQGGLLVVDNVLFRGRVFSPGKSDRGSLDEPISGSRSRSLKAADKLGRAIDEFNKAVDADPRTEQVLLPLRDGMTLIRRVQ